MRSGGTTDGTEERTNSDGTYTHQHARVGGDDNDESFLNAFSVSNCKL